MGLSQRTATFAVVARSACSHHVVPGVLAAAMTRHHMVQRQVVPPFAAVLAGVVVALEDLPLHTFSG